MLGTQSDPADAARPALAAHLPGLHLRAEAPELTFAEIGQFEEAADQALGGFSVDHAAGLCQTLQPRRQVRRLADHRLFQRRTLANEIADHDHAGRDAGARRQCSASVGGQSADCIGQLEGGSDRALGVVLVRSRPAEIREHPVADVLGDVALVTGDHAGARILISADHSPHVFGIEPRRQRHRPDQIHEHHRQLPPLRFGGSSPPGNPIRVRDG